MAEEVLLSHPSASAAAGAEGWGALTFWQGAPPGTNESVPFQNAPKIGFFRSLFSPGTGWCSVLACGARSLRRVARGQAPRRLGAHDFDVSCQADQGQKANAPVVEIH